MSIPNFYQRYLVADQIQKRLATTGAMVGSVYVHEDKVQVNLGYGEFGDDQALNAWSSPQRREDAVSDFLTHYPDATISREKDYAGKPQMIVSGTAAHGIEWKIDFRDGVCERVQVGTKKVERVDMDAYAALPKVEVSEPIFEYICADPITQAGLVNA